VLHVLEATVRVLENHGARISASSPHVDGASEAFLHLRAAEFVSEWGDALEAYPDDFNEHLTWNINLGRTLSGRDIMRAQERQTTLMRGAARFFEDYDLLLAPAATVPPFPISWDYPRRVAGEDQHNYLDWMRAATSISMLGTPALSLPAGFTDAGLPVGLQMVSAFGSDTRLLGMARTVESLTNFAYHRPTSPLSNPSTTAAV
jgi:amidase